MNSDATSMILARRRPALAIGGIALAVGALLTAWAYSQPRGTASAAILVSDLALAIGWGAAACAVETRGRPARFYLIVAAAASLTEAITAPRLLVVQLFLAQPTLALVLVAASATIAARAALPRAARWVLIGPASFSALVAAAIAIPQFDPLYSAPYLFTASVLVAGVVFTVVGLLRTPAAGVTAGSPPTGTFAGSVVSTVGAIVGVVIHVWVGLGLGFAMLAWADARIPDDPLGGLDAMYAHYPASAIEFTTFGIVGPFLLDLVVLPIVLVRRRTFAFLVPLAAIALSVGLFFIGLSTFGDPTPILGG